MSAETKLNSVRLKIEYVSFDKLHPDPTNPNRESDAVLEALTRSIQNSGLVQPILALTDGTIIAGHHRFLAARKAGLDEVPVIFLDLSIEQARLLNVGLNRIHGEFDQELLGRLLADLSSVPDIDPTLSGFDDNEIQQILKSLDDREKRDRPESFDLDAALEHETPGRVTMGDVWQLGDHRLMCGDATEPAHVAALLGETKANMAFTDPPYNVALGDHGGRQKGQRRRRLTNDSLPPAEWEAFVRTWASALIAHVDGAIYVCMSSKELPLVSSVLAEEGAHWSDTIIWEKDRFVLGRADFQRQYEPIWYGWREGAKRHWCGDRDQGDVWRIDRPSDSDLHPTMKPLRLIERAIENSSKAGDVVLDLFLGSGSTVIASERTGRACYGMEIDPRYCAVAIRRWESFAGQKAELVFSFTPDTIATL